MKIPGTTLEVVIVSRAVVRDRPTGQILFEVPQESVSEPDEKSWIAGKAQRIARLLASKASMFRDSARIKGSPDHIKQPGEPEPDEEQIA